MRFCLLLLFLCVGCASKRQLSDQAQVSPRAWVQYVEILRGGKPVKFQAHVEQEPDRLVIVGMTPLGSRGFAASLEAGKVELERVTGFPMPLSAEELLFAYQLMFLSGESLQAHLEGNGLRLEQGEQRVHIYKGKQLRALIRYESEARTSGTTTLTHLTQHYEIRVRTLDVEAL